MSPLYLVGVPLTLMVLGVRPGQPCPRWAGAGVVVEVRIGAAPARRVRR